MSLENGSITLRRFFIKGTCKPSSDPMWVAQLKENAFVGKELGLEEENLGWAVFGEELATDFSIENTVYGKFVLFSLRRDSIKVPSSLVNLHLKSRLKERMRSEEVEVIGKKQRGEIKEEIIEELMAKTPTQIQVIQIMIDTARAEVFISSTSDKVLELFEGLFNKSFDLNLSKADFLSTAHQMLEEETFQKVMDDPGISVGDPFEVHPEFEDCMEGRLGASFLTWMLYLLQTGGSFKSKRQGEMGLVLNEYLLLEGEALGSKQVLLKKGALSRCAELAISLNIGKLVSKIRIETARDGVATDSEENVDMEKWNFMVDKLNFDLSSLKVPKHSEGTEVARMLARFNGIIDAFELMEDLFEHFLELRYGQNWEHLTDELRQWVKDLKAGRFDKIIE
jgi:hypothetical protein